MSFSSYRRKSLLSRTAFVAPFICMMTLPPAAIAETGITYGPGNATLQSQSDITSDVTVGAGANVTVQSPTTLAFANHWNGLNIDQSLTVTGSNAQLNIPVAGDGDGVNVIVGGYLNGEAPSGTGVLSVLNGGHLGTQTDNSPDVGNIHIGFGASSVGTANVSGQGSLMQSNYLTVGDGGTGVLNITDGANVVANCVQIANGNPSGKVNNNVGSGTINITNATLTSNDDFYTNWDSNGTVNINNGGALIIRGTLLFGFQTNDNATGILNLNKGGMLEVSGVGGGMYVDKLVNGVLKSIVVQGVIGEDEGQNGHYEFNLAGGTMKFIKANLATDINMTLVKGTESTIDTNGYTGTLTGMLLGGGDLVKDGAGTLILGATNNQIGGLDVENGTVQFGVAGTPTNYNSASDGQITIPISPGTVANASPVQISGSATLSGLLNVEVANPSAGNQYVIGSKYHVLTAADGVSGSFSNVVLSGAYARYLSATPIYSQNNVEIALLASNSTINSGRFYASNAFVQNQALFNTLSAPVDTGAGYWLHGLGSYGHAPGVTYNYKGFVIGRGFSVNPDLIIGGAVSNTYTHTAGDNGSYMDGTNFGGELYGVYTMQRWVFTGTGAVGHLGDRATRYMPGLGAGKSSSNGIYEGLSLRAQYGWLNDGPMFVAPYATVSYLHTHMGSGQESGLEALDAHYGRVSTDLMQVGGGLTGGYRSMTSDGTLTSWVSIGGLGTLGNTHTRVAESFGTQTASVTGEAAAPGAFTPSAGIDLTGSTAPWQVAATWNGQFASRSSSQAFTLQASYKF